MHRWNIFRIEVLSTPSSPQIKTVKPPDKKPGISDRSSFLLRRSVKFLVRLAETVLQNSPGRAASKATWLHYSSSGYTKNCSCVCARCAYGSIIWKRTSYRNDDLSTTCQCRQLTLNPLSAQIDIYCLMTNQMPALLIQRAPWTRAAVMLLQSLYFSRPFPLQL